MSDVTTAPSTAPGGDPTPTDRGATTADVTDAAVSDEGAFVDRASIGFALSVMRNDRVGWGIALALWTAVYMLPLPAGLFAQQMFDGIEADSGSVWTWLIALSAAEIGRYAVLGLAIVQWHGCFVLWNTVPRLNILRSLVADPGPVTGRLPGSPGEAVSRFRDDARDVAMVIDVWLDVIAAIVMTITAFVVLVTIDPFAALVIVAPVVAVLWIGRALGAKIRQWRWDERRRTARVTDFLGEVFGGITAVKVAGAESAVVERFDELGHARAKAARRDQVGTQMFRSLSAITANLGIGLAMLAVIAPLRAGDLGVGEMAVFTAYATAVASLPRVVGAQVIFRRQADVSVARLGRLLPERTPERAAGLVDTYLRHGPPSYQPPVTPHPQSVHPPVTPHQPPPYDPRSLAAPDDRADGDRLETLSVRGLAVHFDGATPLHGVDLDVKRGQLVVITGEVGAGKSVLLRALLGLVPRSEGRIEWNGEPVGDPSIELVPPRVAYLPQVPRLFSETLAETVLLGVEEERLDEALWLACLDEDLSELPDGSDTRVGPKGVRLSGGQIQRTAAARAFVREPELLVIDDLSSALDVSTEAVLWDRLFARRGDRTVLAVSHRPRVLEAADTVIDLTAATADPVRQ